MGSDKEKAKMEKKRLKAQLKAEKARAKAGEPARTEGQPASEKIPWHRDPNWVRAIVALATLIVLALTLAFTVLK